MLLACGLAACVLAGCTRRHTVEKTRTGAPEYEELRLVYELRDGYGALGSRGLQPVQLVSGTEGEAARTADHLWGTATLRVEYPHPDARPGWARATLRLSPDERSIARASRATEAPSAERPTGLTGRVRNLLPWGAEEAGGEMVAPDPFIEHTPPTEPNQQTADEIWVLDIRREQLDLLLVELARSGYFEDQTRPVGGAHVSVRIDSGMEEKLWDPDPRLDDLAERVYTQGWIRGFAKSKPGTETAGSWWSF